MERIFVSYTQADLSWAEWIAWQLEEAGYSAVFDRWDFPAGSNLVLDMDQAAREAGVTLAVLSPAYLQAVYTQAEWAAAFVQDPAGRESRLIPVRVHDCEPAGLLRSIVYVDLVGQDEDTALRTLLQGVSRSRRKPAGKPAFPSPRGPAPSFPGPDPSPRYLDDEVRGLSEQLKEAFARKEALASAGADTASVQQEILDLRRRIREGGQLKAGDFLLDGRFRLIEAIGRGGFATVWKAYDRRDHLLVAVKVLHVDLAHDRTRRERFFRGARQMATLQHQGVVRVVEREVEDGGYRAFVMEYLEGGDLREAVLSGRLSVEQRLRIVLEAGEALQFAHHQGVIHRDVKPANILLTRGLQAKLSDFDLVRARDTTGGTRTGMLGTVVYAAPEAMARAQEVDRPADVYGLGMTAVFALHGEELQLDVLRDAPSFIDGLVCPRHLKEALRRAVSWRIADRFDSVSELCDALRSAMATLDPAEGDGGSVLLPIDGGNGSSPRRRSTPRLNSRYRFETLVVGAFNQFAVAAARAVAENPGEAYNPFFLYAGPGLGKTHLLQAVANAILSRNPGANVLYLPAEQFVNELIQSIRFDRMPAFRDRMRHVDALLIDDIQFLANKERSQEEFFHCFNALYESRLQIVLASDSAPRQIPTLEERLRSRFEFGLIADIQPPSLEDKTAIVRRKGLEQGVEITEETARFIAALGRNNVSELEGLFNRVLAYSSFAGRTPTVELAAESLKTIVPPPGHSVGADAIIRHVARHYDLKVSEIKSRNNAKHIAYPRQVAMYLCKRLTDLSFADIGRKFNDKHHTTVMYAVDKLGSLRATDPEFDSVLAQLEERLK